MPRQRELPPTDGYIILQFPQGWGGQNSDSPADILAPGQLSAAVDIYHRGPELLRREGTYREPSGQVSAGATIVAGFAADFSTGRKMIVQIDSGFFYQSSGSHVPWAQMTVAGTPSAFGTPATFAILGDVVGIATNGGQLLGASSTDHVFALDAGLTGVSAAPNARFIITYKNSFFAAGHDVSADEVRYSAIGATTGLPVVTDWYSIGNAGNRLFSQGEGGRIIGLAAGRDEWYVFKPKRTTIVAGSTPTKWSNLDVDREVGFHHRSVTVVGRGLVGVNEDGIFSMLDGKVEPIHLGRLVDYWRGLSLTNVSAFQTAWSGSRDQLRIITQTSAGQPQMLTGVLEVGRPIAWYPWPSISARAVWSRLAPDGRGDFYRGDMSGGFVHRMDQGTQDVSANYSASFETGILDDGKPWEDKIFRWAWVWGRTRGPWNVSCTFRVHDEDGRPTPLGSNLRLLDLTSAASGPDVKRATYVLDGQYGWGISFRADFNVSAAGSIHRVVIGYDVADKGGRGMAR